MNSNKNKKKSSKKSIKNNEQTNKTSNKHHNNNSNYARRFGLCWHKTIKKKNNQKTHKSELLYVCLLLCCLI